MLKGNLQSACQRVVANNRVERIFFLIRAKMTYLKENPESLYPVQSVDRCFTSTRKVRSPKLREKIWFHLETEYVCRL